MPVTAQPPTIAPDESARAVGLRYVNDSMPGIRRRRTPSGFRYVAPDGSPVRDEATLRRIRSLAVPPAWTDVWICPRENGHLQATGRDARGRKQYRYQPRWRSVRDETKYARVLAFGEALPALRRRVEADLARPGMPREKVLATVVRLLETTLIRVGNEEYARSNRSYGLTTLRSRHVDVNGARVEFRFRGKSGRSHSVRLDDLRLARVVKRLRDLPGQELFQYLDEAGEPQSVGSADVNSYLGEVTGQDFTAKDFRTWAGTVLACLALREAGPSASATEAKRNVAHAIELVAERLANTPAVCRKCYVHPSVLDAYLDGTLQNAVGWNLAAHIDGSADLDTDEQAVLDFLRGHPDRGRNGDRAGRDH